jgi:hypothetical protein
MQQQCNRTACDNYIYISRVNVNTADKFILLNKTWCKKVNKIRIKNRIKIEIQLKLNYWPQI